VSRLHVAFFNRAFFPEVSATGQLLTELAEGLARDHGCRVSVVAGMPLGASAGVDRGRWGLVIRERFGDIEILRARGTRWSKRTLAGRITNYLTYFGSACWAGLQLDHPDVIIALTDPPVIGLAALLAARRFRARLVISYRDLFPEVARLLDGFRSPVIEWGLHRVNDLLLHQADRVVALGTAMRTRLIQKGAPPERVTIIPDWADCAAIVPAEKSNPFARAHGLADRFVVMHSGNLGMSQNLEIVVEAAAQLRDLADLVMVFVGDGVKKPALEILVATRGLTNVRFLQYQPQARLTESFATADCFVVSLKPGLAGYITPSKLYGILAAGRPYIAAVDDECDVARITREYDCGLVVPPGDAAALASAIRALYADRARARQLGANARRAAATFDRPRGVAAYATLCRELVDGSGGAR